MVLFQPLLIFAIWELRTAWSPWFATFVGLWPANAFITEFKFDIVPAALLVLGIVLALRDRWFLAGLALGLGTAVKWTPALVAVALALWLLTIDRRRAAAAHLGGAVVAFLAVTVPFLVWSTNRVLHAYTAQGGRALTGESLFYVPLKALGLAQADEPWYRADVPGWANPGAIAVQGLALLGCLMMLVAVRKSTRAALSIAAMTPVVFLIFNRVFSPQFLIVLFAAWAVAGSLLAVTRTDQLLLGGVVACATLANALVYPTLASFWGVCSGMLFLCALGATLWVFARSRERNSVVLRNMARVVTTRS